jgi:hypothetical protein
MFGCHKDSSLHLAFAKGSPIPGAITGWFIRQLAKLSALCGNRKRSFGYAGCCVGSRGGSVPRCTQV